MPGHSARPGLAMAATTQQESTKKNEQRVCVVGVEMGKFVQLLCFLKTRSIFNFLLKFRLLVPELGCSQNQHFLLISVHVNSWFILVETMEWSIFPTQKVQTKHFTGKKIRLPYRNVTGGAVPQHFAMNDVFCRRKNLKLKP